MKLISESLGKPNTFEHPFPTGDDGPKPRINIDPRHKPIDSPPMFEEPAKPVTDGGNMSTRRPLITKLNQPEEKKQEHDSEMVDFNDYNEQPEELDFRFRDRGPTHHY